MRRSVAASATPHALVALVALAPLVTACESSSGKESPRYSAALLASTAARFPSLAELSRVELRLSFATLFDNPLRRRASLGQLRGFGASGKQSSVLTPVALKPIGHFTRLVCSYPKLEVSLPGRRGARTRLFVVPHCADAGNKAGVPDERHLRRHHLAYRLQEALGLPRLHSRLIRLDYIDRGPRSAGRRLTGKRILNKPALLLEDAADLARRRVGSASRLRIDRIDRGSYRLLDADATARFHLFQLLIGNHDWQLFELLPLSRYARKDASAKVLHNAIVIDPPPGAGKALPVAFDFDLSSLVGVPESIRDLGGAHVDHYLRQLINPRFLSGEQSRYRWVVLGLQHARRHHGAAADRARASFLRRESALRGVITTASQADRNQARGHLDSFYRALRAGYGLAQAARDAPLRAAVGKQPVLCTLAKGSPLQLLERRDGEARVRLAQRIMLRWGKSPEPSCRDRRGQAVSVDVGWIPASALATARTPEQQQHKPQHPR
jgi:hypothetical protein